MLDNPRISLGSEVIRHIRAGDAEQAADVLRHEGMKKGVEQFMHLAGRSELGRAALDLIAGESVDDPRLHTNVAGIELDGPTGIAPGWDKTGKTIQAWQALGARHITPGATTLFPQNGSRMPRLRTVGEVRGDHGKAISLNSFGFWNPGVDQVVYNIQKQKQIAEVDIPIIVQVTLNKEFYYPDNRDMVPRILAETVKRVLPVADGINLGLSSPNTPGMRDAQDAQEFLSQTIYAVAYTIKESDYDVPVILKGDGDGGEERMDKYARIIEYSEAGLFDAFELINTTGLNHIKARYGLEDLPGGLAGADSEFQQMALDAVKYVYERVGGRVDIIGVGGINGPQQALKMIEAGASAISINTAVRTLGLGAVRFIERGLAQQLNKKYPEATALDQVIGAATKRGPKKFGKDSPEEIERKIAERIRTGIYPSENL